MNTVGYDIGVPGNHEFDFSFDTLLERVDQLNYPIICSNLVYSDTGKNVFTEYMVIEKQGVKIGFFGLLSEETPVSTMAGNLGPSEVTDPVDAAKRMANILKKEKVDCIVAICHMGVVKEGYTTSDELCAQVSGIDICIDSHSHTEMEDGKVCDGSIELVKSNTAIASTGCNLKNVGVITVDAGKISAKLYRGPALEYKTTSDVVKQVEDEVDRKMAGVVGHTAILLDGERNNVRNNETNLGDLITDAMRLATDSTVAIINGGGIRSSIQAGDITLGDVFDVMPFQNFTCILNVPGSALWDEMEFSLALKGSSKGGYLQYSGMTVTYDPSAADNQKVKSIKINGEEIDKIATYKIATIDFIATGGDGNSYLVGYPKQIDATVESIFIDYLAEIGTVTDSMIEGNRLIEA
ncbi:5'-nucleotidase [methanogenic archaeon mixed culture ISO4-G1]|nr:5'-nucleotidase [methanogenic archaeon mixed culture ISO4-G1]